MNLSVATVNKLIFLPLFFLLGYHQIIDLDLGWHLASGKEIIELGVVQSSDDFLIQPNSWINYSWLPEVLFWCCYVAVDFVGLKVLQGILCLGLGFTQIYLISKFNPRPFIFLLALSLLLIGSYPYFQLRPQLISLIIICLSLGLSKNDDKFSYFMVILLSIILVNTHVYFFIFLLVQILLLAHKFYSEEKTETVYLILLILASTLINPYGIYIYEPIIEYALNHQYASKIVTEFHSVTDDKGLLLHFFIIFIPFLFGCSRYFKRGISISEVAIYLLISSLFCILSFFQRKYVPLFSLFSVLFIVNAFNDSKNSFNNLQVVSLRKIIFFYFLYLGSIFLNIDLSTVSPKLIALNNLLKSYRIEGNIITHFDDGGWVTFFSKVNNIKSRVSFDGRTLVMGENRLRDFVNMKFNESFFCSYAANNNVSYLIVGQDNKHFKFIDSCFRIVKDDTYWKLYRYE